MIGLYVLGVLCLMMSGAFICTMIVDYYSFMVPPHWSQWVFMIAGFVLGNVSLISCLGKSCVERI